MGRAGRITVIIPAYNIEAYLGKCLEGVLAQTCRELEIILVDDGSTDGTGAVCDAFAARDERIRVIHQSNGGLSRARNAALETANGDWIAFVDGDDLIPPEACEKLLSCGEKTGADLVIGQRIKFTGNSPAPAPAEKKEPELLKAEEALLRIFYRRLPCYAWGKLYRRRLFDNLRFPEGMIFEDTWLVPDLVSRAEKIAVIPDVVYLYRQTENSIVHAGFSPRKMDQLKAIEHNFSRYESRGEAYQRALKAWKFYACADLLGRVYAEKGFEQEKQLLLRGIQETKHTVCRDPACPKAERLMALAAGVSPKLLAWASWRGRKKTLRGGK